MLEFADAPYEFYAAKPNPLILWLGRIMNRARTLSGPNHRISEVLVSGQERLEKARRDGGKRLFFVANHSTHSDPQIFVETQRQLGVTSCYMAAYDVFLRGNLQGWLMQRAGCFSVNRDGNDSRSMREAIRILSENRYALTVFPEGNVYLMNDRVTPFLDGAAFMGMKAQKQVGETLPIYIVPVSIKVTHETDQRETIRVKLKELAADVGTEVDATAPFEQEIKRVGLIALQRALKQRGLLPKERDGGPLRGHLEHCAELMIERLEEKMGMHVKPNDALNDRVRKLRSRVHKVRTDPSAKADHQVASTWADEAMIALRVLSYAGDYLETPTLDRCGESVEKLLEDIYSLVFPPYGDRLALVEINEPIRLSDHLDAYAANAREAVTGLTRQCEDAVQAGLETLNQGNSAPGQELF